MCRLLCKPRLLKYLRRFGGKQADGTRSVPATYKKANRRVLLTEERGGPYFGLLADCDWMRRFETSEGQACFCTSREVDLGPRKKCLAPPSECEARSSIPCNSCTNSIGSFDLRFAAESAGFRDKRRKHQPLPVNFPSPLQPLLLYSMNASWGSILSRNFPAIAVLQLARRLLARSGGSQAGSIANRRRRRGGTGLFRDCRQWSTIDPERLT